MSKKYCENCGAAMPEESKFCTECGTPFPTVKKEDKPAPAPAQSEVQPDQQNGPDAADPLDALMTRPENTPYAEPQQPAQPGQTQFADPGSQPGVQPGVQPIPTVQPAQTGNTGSTAAPRRPRLRSSLWGRSSYSNRPVRSPRCSSSGPRRPKAARPTSITSGSP